MLLIIAVLGEPGQLWSGRTGTEETRLPILMYHEVRWNDPGKDSVTPDELESDLRCLAEEGYCTVLISDLIAFVRSGTPLPEKPVLITFDDGYFSNYTHAFPLLRRWNAKAVMFVIGRSADEFSLLPENGGPYVHASWAQLLEMRGSGLVELQNHSYDMHRITGGSRGCLCRPGESGSAYEARLRLDTDRMQETLYARTGEAACAYAYPYGLYDAASEGILSELGIECTLTCDFGMNRLTGDPECLLGMKRICRSHGADLKALLDRAERMA